MSCVVYQGNAQISVFNCDVNPVVLQSDIDQANYELYRPCVIMGQGDFYNISQSDEKKIVASESISVSENFHAGPFNKDGELHLQIRPQPIDVVLMNHNDMNNIPVYDKFELGINLSSDLMALVDDFILNGAQPGNINPFDPDQLNIRADFYVLGGVGTISQWYGPYKQYGFYYEDFIRDTPNASYLPVNTGEYEFRVRYTPKNVALHKCVVTVTTNTGVNLTTDEFFFNVVPSSNKPFLRVGDNNRYFMRGNDPYFAVGQNLPWPSDPSGGYPGVTIAPQYFEEYHNDIEDYHQYGSDYFRMILSPWTFGVEFEKLGDYSDRMANAWELDELINHVNELDMLIHLNLQIHFTFEDPNEYTRVMWDWPDESNPLYNGCSVSWDRPFCYAEIPGVNSVEDFLTNPIAIKYYKQRLRYIISRWGYSTNIALLELFSEMNNFGKQTELNDSTCSADHVVFNPYKDDTQFRAKIVDWQKEMCRYIKEDLQMNNHPIAVSYTGTPRIDNNTIDTWDGCLIGHGDDTYYSDYVDIWTYNHYGVGVHKFISEVNTFYKLNHPSEIFFSSGTESVVSNYGNGSPNPNYLGKPLLYSETGSGDYGQCDNFLVAKKAVLLSPFTGAAGSAMPWEFRNGSPEFANNVNLRHDFFSLQKNVRNYFQGIQLDNENWWPAYDIRNDHKSDLIYLTNNNNKAIGAVHNRTINYYTYGNGSGECDLSESELADFEDNYENPINVNASSGFNALKIQNMGTHYYAIEWYNPITNYYYPTVYEWSVLGSLNLPYPTLESNLDHSILYFKVHRWNQNFINEEYTEYDNLVKTNESKATDVSTLHDDTQLSLSVHPNPTNDVCIIEFTGTCGDQLKLLYNAQGIMMKEIEVELDKIILDMGKFASGVYTIYFQDDCVHEFVKLIKN